MPKASAFLDIPADTFLPRLAERAAAVGATVGREGGRVVIAAGLGTVEGSAERSGSRLVVSAADGGQLGALVEVVNGFLTAALGRVPDWTGRPGPGLTMARFESVAQISPSFRRVRLSGDFASFLGGGLHFRLLLGPEGAPWPRPAEAGLDWPGGIDAWHRPPYTIRRLGPEAHWMDVDIFVHAGGRVTEWTEDARPGDEIALTGPGGRSVKQAGWLGLVGDETALPVILRALEAAGPDTRGEAHILIPDAADAQPVALPPGLSLNWVPRGQGVDLLDLFGRLRPPAADRSVFFAGERAQAARARGIGQSLGLTAGEIHAAAYWTAGWVPPAGQRQARRRG